MIDYIDAHEFSSNNRQPLLNDKICGCFNCLNIFSPKDIKEWLPEQSGTAICPYCGIDAIIGEYSGYPITKDFLKKMQRYWF